MFHITNNTSENKDKKSQEWRMFHQLRIQLINNTVNSVNKANKFMMKEILVKDE